MAKLFFKYSSMNAGKSTALIQAAFNYEERGHRVYLIKPSLDTKSPFVSSRIGIQRRVDLHTLSDTNVLDVIIAQHAISPISCILVDEVQFLTAQQVEQLFLIAVLHDIPVMGYGLRTDFQTHSFAGSKRMLELAHVLEEMKTICRCGAKAVLNARKQQGIFVGSGDQVSIDEGKDITYESLCGSCYVKLVGF